MNYDDEEWKVVNYKNIKPNTYSISNYGRLRNICTNKDLHPWKCKNGYLYGSFMCTNNKKYSIGIHVIVCHHFIEIPERLKNTRKKIVPNHKDFNRSNNYYKNLEWVTYSENNEYNVLHGHVKMNDKAPNAKITNKTVKKICKLMEDGKKNKEIIKILNLPYDRYHKSLLSRIRSGSQWKSISSKYSISIRNTLRGNYTNEFLNSICYMIENGYTLKQMRKELNISNDKNEKQKFKNLVSGIRLRRNYKEISDNYTWFK